jgi:hypothetical protein
VEKAGPSAAVAELISAAAEPETKSDLSRSRSRGGFGTSTSTPGTSSPALRTPRATVDARARLWALSAAARTRKPSRPCHHKAREWGFFVRRSYGESGCH